MAEKTTGSIEPKKFVRFGDLTKDQVMKLPLVKAEIKKFTMGKGNAAQIRYVLTLEAHNCIHIKVNLSEAQFVNASIYWEKDGRALFTGYVPVYYTKGVDKLGSPFYFYELLLYPGCVIRGMFADDQITTLNLLEKKGSGITFVEREKIDSAIIQEFVTDSKE